MDRYTVATIDRRLSSIGYYHKQARHTLPTKDPEVERTMRGIRRTKGIAPNGKAPILTPLLRQMVAALPEDLPGLRLPTIPHLVDDLERSLQAIGIEAPVDIAGNSLGGSMALEAAKRGSARSVVAISPAGLWKGHGAPHVKYVFGGLRFLASNCLPLLKATVQIPLLRELALAVPLSVGSRRMPVSDALGAVNDLAISPAFEATFANTLEPFKGGSIAVPVTVAFGERDWILLKRWRRKNELPEHTRWVEKRSWGHVPMWVDPVGVSQLVLEGTQ